MRRLLVALLMTSALAVAVAQTVTDDSATTRPSISQHLRATGRVTIEQDARLEALVGTTARAYYGTARTPRNPNYTYTKGYRVRVFSGNNQTQSRNTAYSIERDMKERMPELETYVVFKSPNWRLLVGNYRTSEEAVAALRTLKRAFPTWGREMFVVKEDNIEIGVDE